MNESLLKDMAVKCAEDAVIEQVWEENLHNFLGEGTFRFGKYAITINLVAVKFDAQGIESANVQLVSVYNDDDEVEYPITDSDNEIFNEEFGRHWWGYTFPIEED